MLQEIKTLKLKRIFGLQFVYPGNHSDIWMEKFKLQEISGIIETKSKTS